MQGVVAAAQQQQQHQQEEQVAADCVHNKVSLKHLYSSSSSIKGIRLRRVLGSNSLFQVLHQHLLLFLLLLLLLLMQQVHHSEAVADFIGKFGANKEKLCLGVPYDEESITTYEHLLLENAARWRDTWESASLTVKVAFVNNFVPFSWEEGRGTMKNPLRLLGEHLQHFLKTPRPPVPSNSNNSSSSSSSNNVNSDLRDYILTLVLLLGIFGAATEKILFLQRLEAMHSRSGIPVPFLGIRRDVELPSEKEVKEKKRKEAAARAAAAAIKAAAEGESAIGTAAAAAAAAAAAEKAAEDEDEEGVTFNEFVSKFNIQGINGDKLKGKVPRVYAWLLFLLLLHMFVYNNSIYLAHRHFDLFLRGVCSKGFPNNERVSSFTIPYSQQPFAAHYAVVHPPNVLQRQGSAAALLKQTLIDYTREEDDWSIDTVVELIKRQAKADEDFYQTTMHWKIEAVTSPYTRPLTERDLESLYFFLK